MTNANLFSVCSMIYNDVEQRGYDIIKMRIYNFLYTCVDARDLDRIEGADTHERTKNVMEHLSLWRYDVNLIKTERL